MNGLFTMIKMNLKLLLRNKGYLSFLIILPIVSVFLLNVQSFGSTDTSESPYIIHELSKEDEMVNNMANNKLTIRVYDYSASELSDYIIQELAKTGSYHIYRYQGEAAYINEARENAIDSANHNMIGAVIYIPDTFESEILKKGDSNIVVFETSQDQRLELLKKNLEAYQQSVVWYAALSDYDKDALASLLITSGKNEISKEVVKVAVGDNLNLNENQQCKSFSIGYSLSILTISFLFSGVFIAATVVEERRNRVYNRFVLSKISLGKYGFVKLLTIFMTVLIQTGILAVAIKLFVKSDFGIPYASYLFLVFCLGLIFNLLSVVIGVITNNVVSSNYIAFLIWCMSDLFAGLYFPMDGASKLWIRVTMLMPQHWVVKTSEMIMAGENGAYLMYILIVLSYLAMIASVGLIGIKIQRKE